MRNTSAYLILTLGLLCLCGAPVARAQQVKIMQYNIEGHLGNSTNNNTAAAKALARIINYTQPDIITFCELEDHGTIDTAAGVIDWVTNNLTYFGNKTGVTFWVDIATKGDGFERNGSISRYPISNAVTYSDGGGGFSNLRGMESFTAQLSGTNTLEVFHVHLKCCSTTTSCPRKQAEAEIDATNMIVWASTNLAPYVFTGDCNEDEDPRDTPECTITSIYHPITTLLRGAGLVDFEPTNLEGDTNGWWRTWSTAAWPSAPSIRFDYVLAATNRLSPVSGIVFNTMNWASHGLYTNASPENLVNDSQTASDHYTVLVTYFLPTTGATNFNVTPVTTFTSSGNPGGPFSPSSQVYTWTNTDTIPLFWSVTVTSSWVTVSATAGTLGAGMSTNISVSITNSAANSLPAGTYVDVINFSNTATGVSLPRGIILGTAPPVADFSANPTNGAAPLVVTFTDASSGVITNEYWDFGDGATTNTFAASVVHTYSAARTNTVLLIASGPLGVSTNTRVNYIVVAPPCGSLSATNHSFGVLGGSNTVTVIASTSNCSWTASSNDNWIQIAGGGVSTAGTAIVTYSVLPNTSSSSPRTGTMTIAGQTFTVTEDGDPIAPTVALTAPTSGNISNTIAVSAAAADNIAVVKAEFYRDGGVLLGSVGTAPYSMNFDTTAVADGTHCFYARAYDGANNAGSSSTNCVTVDNNAPTVPTGLIATGIATNQIDLRWSASTDSGSGVAGYKVFRDGTQIATTAGTNYSDVGLATGTEHCYKVAAYDTIGHASAQSAEVCAQSLATVDMLLGSYNGLVIRTNAPSHATSGSIKLALSKTGSFAASVALGGAKAVGFTGRFDAAGNATNAVAGPGQNSSRVVLHLDLGGSDQIIGTVSNAVFTSELLADRAAYSHKNPCPLAGKFTAVLQPPEGDDPNFPQGFGYGTLTVTTSGQGRLTGVLSDGTKVSVRVPLSKLGTWPLYQALYNKGGASIGWVTFGTNNTLDATVDWFRPKMPTSQYFPGGFTTNVTLLGRKYVRPVDITPSSAGSNGRITLGGGNLESSIVKTVFVYATGKVAVPSPNNENVQMKFRPTTGQFSGSFIHPSLNTTINFTGLALEFRGDGAGYFLGTNESGFVTFEPTP